MANNKKEKDIIARFEAFFTKSRITQRDNFRHRLVIAPSKAALFVQDKLDEGYSAKESVEWLLEFFVVSAAQTATIVGERHGTQALIDLVADIVPKGGRKPSAATLASDPEAIGRQKATTTDPETPEDDEEIETPEDEDGDEVETEESGDDTAALSDDPKPLSKSQQRRKAVMNVQTPEDGGVVTDIK